MNRAVPTFMVVPSLACQASCTYCFGPHEGAVMVGVGKARFCAPDRALLHDYCTYYIKELTERFPIISQQKTKQFPPLASLVTGC